MVEIRKQSVVPGSVEDLRPGARPFDAKEADCRVRVRANNAAGWTIGHMRLRIIRLVDETQNAVKPVVKVLGPATGEDSIYIPCDGQVELAHIDELFEAAVRRRQERARLRALHHPQKQDAWRAAMLEKVLDAIEQKKGRSTYGYGGELRRSS